MSIELEYKLSVPSRERLETILADSGIAALVEGAWRETPMQTTYFDAPDCRFSARRWALRLRSEADTHVLCLKTPVGAGIHSRNEWQICAPALNETTVRQLVAAGAPEELLRLFSADIRPVCGAVFTRRSAMLRFSDGSRAELAGDCGVLHGLSERLPFTELELELYEGGAEQMRSLAYRLCTTYGISPLEQSKFARARMLK